jgi:PAS domain S-box-containing protein
MTKAEVSPLPIRPEPKADPLAVDAPRREEEFAELVEKLHEAHEMIDAIRRGGVDSLVIGPPGEERVYDLSGKDSAYRFIVEGMNEGAATVDDHGAILYANPRLATLTGRPVDELVGSTALELTTQEYRESFAHLLDVGTGDSVRGELDLACADGATLPIVMDVSALDADGSHVRFLVMSDRARRPAPRGLAEPAEPLEPHEPSRARETMSQRISDDAPTGLAHIDAAGEHRAEPELGPLPSDLEARVQSRTIDLRRADRSLEPITDSATHALRTLSRSLSTFSEALTDDYADRLDAVGRAYAERIRWGADRMDQVVDDLTQLAGLSQARLRLETVDLSAEVTALAEELQRGEPDWHVRFVIDAGVTARTDLVLIRSTLEHLLGNARRFTIGRDNASVEFGTIRVDDASICCYVRDNGVGFDPAEADDLFVPFRRLRPTRRSGSGVGLAGVRRIVERLGGRIWAEGALDRGAAFFFTLDAEKAG